jgi:glucose-6-phosphate 1-dehydrogenase
MGEPHADALVFFGATGDLAYKKIFPSLQAMARRGNLNVPVIGVAKAGWTLEQLTARARDSLEKHGGLDPGAFKTLCGPLRHPLAHRVDAVVGHLRIANTRVPRQRAAAGREGPGRG